jgi:quinone-modifying oxidoreductase subunit QmoB
MEEKKTGVYLCSGCGIGEAMDIAKLEALAAKEGKAHVVRTHAFLCGPEGVDLIKKDTAGEGINAVVIGACSPRVNTDVFGFDPVLVERANLREHVAWCQPPKTEDTQLLAHDYLRMSLVRMQKTDAPAPYLSENFARSVLVIGGGITGMTAALEAAEAGTDVVLVEKSPALGGNAAKLHKGTPTRAPYREPEDTGVRETIRRVMEHPRIKVHTGAEVAKTQGGPCLFDVTIQKGSETIEERIGAIVMATGAKPYDPAKLGDLGYGLSPDVITMETYEAMAQKGKIVRPSDGKEVQRAAFVLCAGSRDEKHLPYCSAYCCGAAMKQAVYLRQQNKDASIYLVYDEIRTPGQLEEFYRRVQQDGGMFIKGKVSGVKEEAGKRLSLEVTEALLGSSPAVIGDLDIVVLATGLVPNAGGDNGGVLRLEYRQGPELPTHKYGFPDSHFICFPYETRRTGIYTAGTVRRPMGIAAAREDAAGAALKAIQAIEMTTRGGAVHPRAGDLTYPEFAMQGCTQCKRCTEECPFGAINEDEKSNPILVATRCRRCGTCMGACPQRIISFKNYSVDMIGSMLKSIDVPAEEEEKPRILVFACENDAYPALDMAGINRIPMNPHVRIIPVRCLGSVNLVWISDAMSKGFDGVMLMGCRHGDDYQCHFIKGSEIASVRLSKISETLSRMALEADRVRQEAISIMDFRRAPEILSAFAESLQAFGPNPMKGF